MEETNNAVGDGAMDEADVVRALAALAHVGRLQIFRLLVVTGPDGLTPGQLADTLGMPPATLSFHLKELTSAGLATQQRESRHLIYRAAFGRVQALVGFLTAHCCEGADCGVATQAALASCC